LAVFNLAFETREDAIARVFEKYGPLQDVQLIYRHEHDSRSGASVPKSRGFAFVYFESPDDADDALDETDGMTIDGRVIRVSH